MYQRPPSEIRRRAAAGSASPELSILLPYQSPYDWPTMIGFLAARAIEGLEVITEETYSRTIKFDNGVGTVRVSQVPEQSSLRATIHAPSLSALPPLIARLRRQFDLGADPVAIGNVLSRDPLLAPLVAARPGLRVPGAWDGFEIAVRAVLGQQITVKAATRLAGRLVATLGAPVHPKTAVEGLTHVFPRPEQFQFKALANLGLPRTRAETLVGLAEAAHADPRLFDPRRDLAEAVSSFRAVRGIGEWTAQYIALRAMGESDAFLTGDVGLQRCLSKHGRRPTAAESLARAEAWRPWRAYALLHLWTADADSCQSIKEDYDALTA
jgi:AraC family transcriptional regulator of adaptative response / DNA-3-methyladenine glycosylase II